MGAPRDPGFACQAWVSNRPLGLRSRSVPVIHRHKIRSPNARDDNDHCFSPTVSGGPEFAGCLAGNAGSLSRCRLGGRDFIGGSRSAPKGWQVGAGRWREASVPPRWTSRVPAPRRPASPRASGGERGRGGSHTSRYPAQSHMAPSPLGPVGHSGRPHQRGGTRRQGHHLGGGPPPAGTHEIALETQIFLESASAASPALPD